MKASDVRAKHPTIAFLFVWGFAFCHPTVSLTISPPNEKPPSEEYKKPLNQWRFFIANPKNQTQRLEVIQMFIKIKKAPYPWSNVTLLQLTGKMIQIQDADEPENMVINIMDGDESSKKALTKAGFEIEDATDEDIDRFYR